MEDSVLRPESFSSISAFPTDFVDGLEQAHSTNLRKVGHIEIENVSIKIGKTVSSWRLGGQ